MAPSLVSCLWLVKVFNLPGSPFTHWQNGDKQFLPCRIGKIKGESARENFRTIIIYVNSVVVTIVVTFTNPMGPFQNISTLPKSHRAAAQFWPSTDCHTFSWPPKSALTVPGSMPMLLGAGGGSWGLGAVGKPYLPQLLSPSYFLLCLMKLSEVKAGPGCLLLNKAFLLPHFPFFQHFSSSPCQQPALFQFFSNLKTVGIFFTLPLLLEDGVTLF